MSVSKTLVNFKEYQQKYYEQILKYPYMREVAFHIEKFLRDIIEDGAFYLRVHSKTLPRIIESGRIMNVMETGSSATVGGADVRRESTGVLFGVDTSTLEPQDYPKFGYLSADRISDNLISTYDMVYQYGGVVFRFKKEKLFPFTTLTVGNSMIFKSSYCLIPTLVSNPLATCIRGPVHDAPAGSKPIGKNGVDGYYFFGMKVKEKILNRGNFYDLPELLSDMFGFDFFELQFHCPLILSECLERVDVVTEETDDPEIIKSSKEFFDRAGIPFEVHDTIF
jgi:hypothetical protein